MIWDSNTESFIPIWFDHQDVMLDIEQPGTALAMHYEKNGYLFFPREIDFTRYR